MTDHLSVLSGFLPADANLDKEVYRLKERTYKRVGSNCSDLFVEFNLADCRVLQTKAWSTESKEVCIRGKGIIEKAVTGALKSNNVQRQRDRTKSPKALYYSHRFTQ